MLRSRHIISGLVLAAVVAASSLSGPATAQTPPPSSYLKTFDNYIVDQPTPFVSDASLDVLVHSRNNDTWANLEPMEAEHGSHCEAPPATHHLSGSYPDAVFLCAANPHIMTSIKAGGYGVIYLTPGHMIDLSQGEAVLKFDVSTLRASSRDWIDVWVTPYEDNLVHPLDAGLPDLQGEPKRGILFSLTADNVWSSDIIRNFTRTRTGESCCDNWSMSYTSFLIPSASRRDTVEMRISKTALSVGMPAYNMRWANQTPINPPFDWDRAIVQIGHHSYTPDKDCGSVPQGTDGCRAGTWHWDNISISPSVPFTMIRANERAAVAASNVPMAFTFPQPSPQNAYLRASVHGVSPQVSTDDGATWAPLVRQPSGRTDTGAYQSYWHPIPSGVTKVLLRSPAANGFPQAAVEYASIWADTVQQQPTPATPPPTMTLIPTEPPTSTPAATSTPQPTFTPIPPTSTQAPPTATPLPSTATATTTPGPMGNCSVTIAQDRKSGTWSCP
jgi:hypothetical protein